MKFKLSNNKERLLIALGIITIFANGIFQYFWIKSVYVERERTIYENIQLSLENFGQHQDIAAFGNSIASPTAILPEHLMERVMDSLKVSPQFRNVPDSVGLGMMDSILKGALINQAQNDHNYSDLLERIRKEYPDLKFDVLAINTNLPGTLRESDKPSMRYIDYSLAYKPLKYRLTLYNMNGVVVGEILSNLIVSVLYFIINSSC